MESDRGSFAVCIGAMLETFGIEATDPILHGYWMGLNDLNLHDVELSVAKAIRYRKSLPKPVELRELAGIITDPDAMAQLAFAKAMDAISSQGPYRTVTFEDSTINAVIRSMGGWPNFCGRFTDAESEKWGRIDFIKSYRNYASRPIGEEAGAPLVGLAEFSNNQPEKPRLIGCDWVSDAPRVIHSKQSLELVGLMFKKSDSA